MTNPPPPTAEELWAEATAPAEPDHDVPRDWRGWPLIVPAPGDEHLALKRPKNPAHKGLVPYFRSSYYGGEIEDTFSLVKWQKRQVARGVALLHHRGKFTLPADPAVEPDDRDSKETWNRVADEAEEEVGSYRWATYGTAIHYGTELVDLDGDLSELAPEIRERAEAYWQAKKEWGWQPTSVEVFGVEDVNRVAGTWDRTMWFLGRHVIGDVKTSGSMDRAGIGFAVQLAEYSRMREYDPQTGERRDREIPVDLETGWIIHVDRNPGGPVELHRVNIAEGWRFAGIVRTVMEARAIGRKAIAPHLDPSLAILTRSTSRAELSAAAATLAPMTPAQLEIANALWAALR